MVRHTNFASRDLNRHVESLEAVDTSSAGFAEKHECMVCFCNILRTGPLMAAIPVVISPAINTTSPKQKRLTTLLPARRLSSNATSITIIDSLITSPTLRLTFPNFLGIKNSDGR